MKYLQLKHRLFSLTILTLVAIIAIWPSFHDNNDKPRPEVITLSTGSTKRVANGRAQLWLGEVVSVPVSGGRFEQGAQFEITCDGKTFYGEAISTPPKKPLCGCFVRLVEALETSPPSVRLEIRSSDTVPPNLQAASQALRPPKN